MATNTPLNPLGTIRTVRTIAEVIIIVALLLGGAIAVRSWLAARKSAAQLAATVATQKKLLDESAAREEQRDAAVAKSVAALAKAKAAVKTPSAAAAQIPLALAAALPGLPAPITIELPPAQPQQHNPATRAGESTSNVIKPATGSADTDAASGDHVDIRIGTKTKTGTKRGTKGTKTRTPNPVAPPQTGGAESPSGLSIKFAEPPDRPTPAALPEPMDPRQPANAPSATATAGIPAQAPTSDAPAIATIPQADLVPLYSAIQDCRVCQLRLAAAQADLADERKKEAALTAERDAAVKAAHGGSFWSRAKSAAKWLVLGAAIGATAGAATAAATHR